MKFIEKYILMIALILIVGAPRAALAVNEVVDRDSLRQHFGLNQYSVNGNLKNIKIAILDNGFEGFAPGKGLLPESAELKNLTQIPAGATNHGLGMAQIIWAMTGKLSDGPKFFLVNTNGFSNLKAAVQFVIDEKVDIVLYSQVWPFGGNFDGTGFINDQVTRAINSGVIWINAAGNNGAMVYNGFVEKQRSSTGVFLNFNGRDYLRFENKLDETDVNLTLSWSDFKEDENYNTTKDLDLLIYDDAGRLVGSSELIQRGEAPVAGGDAKLSSHAREAVSLSRLDRGNYQIKVKVNSNNFVSADRFRVLMITNKGGAVVFTDHTSGAEIMPPADNKLAITVGDKADGSASTGPTADGRVKPEIWIDDAKIRFSNGSEYAGSSTAAAIFAAVTAVMKSEVSSLSPVKLRNFISKPQAPSPTQDLDPADLRSVDSAVFRYMPSTGRLMIHRYERRYVILVPNDPFELPEPKAMRLRRLDSEDTLVVSPQEGRWFVIPASLRDRVKGPLVEFRRGSTGAELGGVWQTPTPLDLRRWMGL